jgi:hypothetical protein
MTFWPRLDTWQIAFGVIFVNPLNRRGKCHPKPGGNLGGLDDSAATAFRSLDTSATLAASPRWPMLPAIGVLRRAPLNSRTPMSFPGFKISWQKNRKWERDSSIREMAEK